MERLEARFPGSVNAAAALGVTQALVVDADRRVQLTGSMAERVSLSWVPPAAVTLV